jgi:ankyrin repeat protein
MPFSISARWKGIKDRSKGNGPDSKIPTVARNNTASENNTASGQPKPQTTEVNRIQGVDVVASRWRLNNKAQKNEKAKRAQEKKRLKQILKAHNGNILSALQDATTQGAVTDVQLILNSPKIQRVDYSYPTWEVVLNNVSIRYNTEILKLLLDKLLATSSLSNYFLWQLLEIAVDCELWEHAGSISKRFPDALRLRRVKYTIQDSRELELKFLLREFPEIIKLLDSSTELPRVPEETSRSAFRTLLLRPYSHSLSAALENACKRNSIPDVELLITHPSMNTETSDIWIHAIKSAASEQCPDILSLLLDRAPADNLVREYMLREIRYSVDIVRRDSARIIFTKYLEKYSVLGVWNDMQWNDEQLLELYVDARPSYVREVAEKVGQSVLHFLLSEWGKPSVLGRVIDLEDVDIEAPFKRASKDAASKIATSPDHIVIGNPGDTPLIRATRMGEPKIAELFLNRGADIHVKDTTGRTALHIAAEIGEVSMLNLLLEKGADSQVLTPDGEAAVDLAAKKYRRQAFDLLRRHAGLPPVSIYKLDSNASSSQTTGNLKGTASPSSTYHHSYYWPDVHVTRRRQKYKLSPSDPAYWY